MSLEFDLLNTKEKILKLARRDPFISINDLAELAETTNKYVRTTLSENNYSLQNERRKVVYILRKQNKELKKENKKLTMYRRVSNED